MGTTGWIRRTCKALPVILLFGCTKTLVAPERTPFSYEVYAGDGLVGAETPFYFAWKNEPLYLGGADTTAAFDMAGVESAEYLTITMNRNIERSLRDKPEDLPGEVWIDAVQDLQTGKYLGADADGTVHNFYSVQYLEVYDVLDTATGELSAKPSIGYLIGPPDGRYIVLKRYDTSFIAISSFDGAVGKKTVLTNGPGPDLRVYARRVPPHLQTPPRSRRAPQLRRVSRMRPAKRAR